MNPFLDPSPLPEERTIHTIDSRVHVINPRGEATCYEDSFVKNEPMLFNCDFDAAWKLGGRITHDILWQLPSDWIDTPLVIDSRVHMLMPGWYPCIPGWHHDDVPRTRADGQPNYGPGQNRSEHIVCLVNGDVAPTEFALGPASFIEPREGEVVYEKWHKSVEMLCKTNMLRRWSCPSGKLVWFDDRSWHRGVPAVKNGWRFFIRFSRYFDPYGNPIERGNARTNEVRRQVQVYMDNPNAGW